MVLRKEIFGIASGGPSGGVNVGAPGDALEAFLRALLGRHQEQNMKSYLVIVVLLCSFVSYLKSAPLRPARSTAADVMDAVYVQALSAPVCLGCFRLSAVQSVLM